MQPQLQQIEVEAVLGRDHDLAVDDAAGRQRSEQRVVQFGEVTIERFRVAALDVDTAVAIIGAAKHECTKAVPFRLEQQAGVVRECFRRLGEHRLDRRSDGEGHDANDVTSALRSSGRNRSAAGSPQLSL